MINPQKKKTKVAFFAEILQPGHDGAVRTMFQLINRIDASEFEFLFFCGTSPDSLNGFEVVKIPAYTVPLNRNYKISVPALGKKLINDKLAEFKPDVVHIATPSMLGWFALNYARQHHLPVLSIYHTHFISYVDYYFKHLPFMVGYVRKKVTETTKDFYSSCDKIYIPSESIAGWIKELGVNADHITIWKRGIDTQLFSPDKRNHDLSFNITGNHKPSVIFASRLVWEKNLETLFRIYDRIIEEQIPVNLIIAGDGKERQTCEARMPGAFFMGNVNHNRLSELYASSDIFLFPSVSEAYGNVVLEAMASGLPCVIADGGGSADFIEQGVNGFKCQPYNEDDYIDKIKLILSDHSLRQRFAAAGLRYAKGFDWEQLAHTYFTDLKELAHHEVPEMAV